MKRPSRGCKLIDQILGNLSGSSKKRRIQKTEDMGTYDEYVIVAEEEFYTGRQDRKICIHNAIWEIIEGSSSDGITRVDCKKLRPGTDTCHAEILFISEGSTYTTHSWRDYNAGRYAGKYREPEHYDSVVIRILEKKEKVLKEFDDRSAADVTFLVNGEECEADRKYLAGVSPVFNKMLYGKFAESDKDQIELEGIESAEIFNDFLLAISPLRIQPNPSNVVALLKLAHQYDVPFLLRNCEDHLMRCYEISVFDRLRLAGQYDLSTLKFAITEKLCKKNFVDLLTNKRAKLRDPESDYLFDIIVEHFNKCPSK